MTVQNPPTPPPAPPPLSAEEKAKARTARLGVATAVFALLTAGLGAWGGYQKDQKDDAQQDVTELVGRIKRLETDNSALKADNAELTDENNRLKNTTTTTTAATRSPGTTVTTTPPGKFFGKPIQQTTSALALDTECPDFQGAKPDHAACFSANSDGDGNYFDWHVSGDPAGRTITGSLGMADECTSGSYRLTFILDGNEALKLDTNPFAPLASISIPVSAGQHLFRVQVNTVKAPALSPRLGVCPVIRDFHIA